MNCCIPLVVLSILAGCAEGGYVVMTEQNQPKDLKKCLKFNTLGPQVVCDTNFHVKVYKKEKLTFEIAENCKNAPIILIGSQEYHVYRQILTNKSAIRTVTVFANGETEGLIGILNTATPTPLKMDDSGYVKLEFSVTDCPVTLKDSLPVFSDGLDANGFSQTAIILLSLGGVGIVLGGVVAAVLCVRKRMKNKKTAEENKKDAKEAAKVEKKKKTRSPPETGKVDMEVEKDEKQSSIEQKPSVELKPSVDSDQKVVVASPEKTVLKTRTKEETPVKPTTEEPVFTQKTQEVSVPDKPASIVCGVPVAKKHKKESKKKAKVAVKTAVEKMSTVDPVKKNVDVKISAKKESVVVDNKVKGVDAVKADNKNKVEVASEEPVAQEKVKESEVKDKPEVANKQVPVQQQAVKQVDVKAQPAVEDIKIVVVNQDKKKTRSADDGYKTELELVYDEGAFTEEHKRKEPAPLSLETETQPEIKKSDDAMELNIKRRRTTSESCLPTSRQSEVSRDTKRTTSQETDGRTVLEPFNVYVRPTRLQGGRRPGAFTEEHRRQEAPFKTVEMETRQKRNKRSDDAEELNVRRRQSSLSPCLPVPRQQKPKKEGKRQKSRAANKGTVDDAAVEEVVTPEERARAERRRRDGGEEEDKNKSCCPPRK